MRISFIYKTFFCLLVITQTVAQDFPLGFDSIANYLPNMVIELRYASSDNFIGRTVAGYQNPKKVLTIETLCALQKVQEVLKKKGMTLKLFDGYRPQTAVDDFIRWTQDPNDTLNKARYYPNSNKIELFDLGYIAKRSGHSRGSTIDITLVYSKGPSKGKELDMGSSWDFFGPISWIGTTVITNQQAANRKLLKEIMTSHGFLPYDKEWWHFTLKGEPFPNTYFNF